MKLIIDIDEAHYKDAINDTEWDTLSLGIYLKEQIKNSEPLQAELEQVKAEIQDERSKYSGEGKYTYTAGLKESMDIIDKHIAELKG
ncbi:MAG: hypothetical protein J6S67_00400 [Methanobrevibacter sp.]|nr:hypothetical protein [Methanobrevibacter sp.]